MASTAPRVEGTVADGFEPVRDAFLETVRSRTELGAACAVVYRGEVVVDLWGGYRDVAAERRWTRDTQLLVFSTTKGMVAAAMALAHSRGHFELDDRVAEHWPAFGQHGKDEITVRQLLAHRAGLAALDESVSAEQIADRESFSELLARQRPNWEPGTRHGYHAITLGWYQSELLRHTEGRPLAQYFAEEVAEPLDLEFQVGLPADEDATVAELRDFSPLALFRNPRGLPWRMLAGYAWPWSITRPAMDSVDADRPSEFGGPELGRVEIPSANGVGTVRSIAELYGDLAIGGERLGLDEATVRELTSAPTAPPGGPKDLVLKVKTAYSMGYSKPSADFQFGSSDGAFGTPGAGGSFGFADPDAELGFAYAPNRLGTQLKDDPRERALRDAVYDCLDRT